MESSEMWCWRRMEEISWTDHVRKEEVLLQVNEQRNILRRVKNKQGQPDWSYIADEPPSKTR
jgi:hypothetical protein